MNRFTAQRRIRSSFAILAAAAVVSAPAWAVKEGQWEFTSTMKIPGMTMPQMPQGMQMPPGMKMPAMGPNGMTHTFQTCVTNDKPVPKNDSAHEDCKVTRMDRSGDTVTWSATCTTPQGTMQGDGSATYSGDTMQSSMTMNGTTEHGPMTVQQTTTGRYLGACPAK